MDSNYLLNIFLTACYYGDYQTVREFTINNMVNINQSHTETRMTGLGYAVSMNQLPTIKFLLRNGALVRDNFHGAFAPLLIILKRRLLDINYVFTSQDKEIINELLKYDADINKSVDEVYMNYTDLYHPYDTTNFFSTTISVYGNFTLLKNAIFNNDLEFIKLLLQYGAYPGAFGTLHLACTVGNFNIIKCLISSIHVTNLTELFNKMKRQNTSDISSIRESPLDILCRNKSHEIINLLVSIGVQPSQRTLQQQLNSDPIIYDILINSRNMLWSSLRAPQIISRIEYSCVVCVYLVGIRLYILDGIIPDLPTELWTYILQFILIYQYHNRNNINNNNYPTFNLPFNRNNKNRKHKSLKGGAGASVSLTKKSKHNSKSKININLLAQKILNSTQPYKLLGLKEEDIYTFQNIIKDIKIQDYPKNKKLNTFLNKIKIKY